MWKYLFSYLTICLLNVNGNSLNKKSAVSLNICTLQYEKGPCFHYTNRFYYHYQFDLCMGFEYGGCGGNPNNFKTFEECKKTCHGSAKYIELQKPLYCLNLPDRGYCDKNTTRFYYNPEKNDCEKFLYSECGGNDNRFDDIRKCRMDCMVQEFNLQLKSN